VPENQGELLNRVEGNLNLSSMKKTYSNTSFLFMSILLTFIPLSALAQEKSESSLNAPDTLSVTNKVSPHGLYTGIGFGNNMVLGSTYSQDQHFYYGSLIYGYNNEFFISASTFHLSAFDPFLAYHTFSANYCHVFNDWFDISAGISRYQVAEALTDTLFNSFLYGDFTLGIDWKILYTKLSVGVLFAETTNSYFQIRNSRYFQTPEFFNGKAYISFDPYASLLFGSLTETTTSEGTTIGITSPIHSAGAGKTPTGGSGGSGGSSTTSKTSTFFGLMEVDLGLPVGFNSGKLTVEAEPGYVIPIYTVADLPSPKGFVFMLTCSFKIF